MKEQPDIQVPVPGEPTKERVAAIESHLANNDDFRKMLIAEIRKRKREKIEYFAIEDDDLRESFTAKALKSLSEENHPVTDAEVREAVREIIDDLSWHLAEASGLYWALKILRESDNYWLRLALARELRQALEIKNDEDEGEKWKNAQ